MFAVHSLSLMRRSMAARDGGDDNFWAAPESSLDQDTRNKIVGVSIGAGVFLLILASIYYIITSERREMAYNVPSNPRKQKSRKRDQLREAEEGGTRARAPGAPGGERQPGRLDTPDFTAFNFEVGSSGSGVESAVQSPASITPGPADEQARHTNLPRRQAFDHTMNGAWGLKSMPKKPEEEEGEEHRGKGTLSDKASPADSLEEIDLNA